MRSQQTMAMILLASSPGRGQRHVCSHVKTFVTTADNNSIDHAFVTPQAGQVQHQELALTVSQKIRTKNSFEHCLHRLYRVAHVDSLMAP